MNNEARTTRNSGNICQIGDIGLIKESQTGIWFPTIEVRLYCFGIVNRGCGASTLIDQG